MILIDYSGLAFAAALSHLTTTREEPSTELLRHLVLNSIRAITARHKGTYGPTVVLAMDGKNYWRRNAFPHYKHKRKAQRESSGQDWKKVFELLEPLKQEFPVSLPYKTIRIDDAEADDIIGILGMAYAPHEPILIVSSDKDFIQLHGYGPHVNQYSPAKKAMLNNPHPSQFLKELILNGDTGDGIPNVLSADDTFVAGVRQKPLTKKKLESMMSLPVIDLPLEIQRNYIRNQQLIDFTQIPQTVATQINEAYNQSMPASSQTFLNYLVAHRCTALVSCIQDFL